MSISVVANAANTPPRFEITVTSPDGSAITAVNLNRTANGLTEPVRAQPVPGPSPLVAYDYEAPWGTGVVYTVAITDTAGTQTYPSTSAQLDPALPWLIHPTTPALSIPLDQSATTAMGVREHGTTTRAADAANAFRPLGARYRVVVTNGPRSGTQTQLQVATVTTAEQQALWAIVDDLTPLLIRVPSAWGWDWEDGYYNVGQVDAERFMQYGPEPRRVFTLPLERVQSPAGTQQAQRSWGSLLTEMSSWANVAAGFANWTAVLTDTRS